MAIILKSILMYFVITTSLEYIIALRIAGKYQHNRNELELTKIVKINQNRCLQNETQIFVHSAATTSGKYYDRRLTTRQTWAKNALKNNIRVTFVLAEPQNETTQTEILMESNHYNDILQFGFKDDYHNLTLKAIALLRWISLYCLVGDYILKTDDDVLVNTNRLKDMIKNKSFLKGITGRMFKKSKLVRDINSGYADKWLIPRDVYAEDHYPPYLSGAAYVMSINIIEKLYRSAINYSGPILDIDDLYLTGIIADKYHIERHDGSEFFIQSYNNRDYCGIEVCKMYTILTLHGCDSVNNTLRLWNSWKALTTDFCKSNFVKLNINNIHLTIALIILLIMFIFIIFGWIYFPKLCKRARLECEERK